MFVYIHENVVPCFGLRGFVCNPVLTWCPVSAWGDLYIYIYVYTQKFSLALSLYIYTYIHMYIYILHTYMHIYIYVYTQIYITHIYTHKYIYIYIYIHVRICTSVASCLLRISYWSLPIAYCPMHIGCFYYMS